MNKSHCKGMCRSHYDKAIYQGEKDKQSDRAKSNLSILKTQVFGYYSNFKFRCNCCGEFGLEFLTIDHINGKKSDGHSLDMKGKKLYSWLRRNNYPSGYQVLCWNCNSAKGIYGECPHQSKYS